MKIGEAMMKEEKICWDRRSSVRKERGWERRWGEAVRGEERDLGTAPQSQLDSLTKGH